MLTELLAYYAQVLRSKHNYYFPILLFCIFYLWFSCLPFTVLFLFFLSLLFFLLCSFFCSLYFYLSCSNSGLELLQLLFCFYFFYKSLYAVFACFKTKIYSPCKTVWWTLITSCCTELIDSLTKRLKVQSSKLYKNKYMVASTQITNTWNVCIHICSSF